MPQASKTSGWTARELRTRYVPKSRLRNGLVSISPWLDLVLVLVFALFLESRIVLRPGVVVELPVATFEEGVENGMVAVVLSIDSPEGKTELVFFNDKPYTAGNAQRMEELKSALSDYRRDHSDTSLTLYADSGVFHGTVLRLVQMAREVGVDRVNMATQSESGR